MNKLIDRVFDIFSSLRLTVILLIIILIYLSVSTFLPQESSYLKYLAENRPLLFLLLRITGLTNPYHSFTVILWLFLFTFNLIACSLNRLPAIVERIKRNRSPVYISTESMTKHSFSPPAASKGDITEILKNRGYNISETEKDGNQYIICKKGIYAPVSFLLVHISVLIIIAGITVSALFGYEGFIRLTEGKTENLYYREIIRGNYIKVPLPFRFRLNSFSNITLSTGQSVEYISDITIYDTNNELRTRIRVNDPLEYKGILFVQSSYEANTDEAVFSLRITDDSGEKSENIKIGLKDQAEFMGKRLKITDFFENVHNMGEAIKIQYGDTTVVALKNRPEIQNEESGIRVYIEDIKVPYDSILRITYDPGTKTVFLGSFLLLISLILVIFYKFRMIAIRTSNNLEILYSGKRAESDISLIASLTEAGSKEK